MASLEAVLNKKYKLSTSENFDDFMKALGEFFFFWHYTHARYMNLNLKKIILLYQF